MLHITEQQAKVLKLLYAEREKAKKKLEPEKKDYTWQFDKENYRLKKVLHTEQLSLL